jgi:outer membrane receptor for ferrienterochelin and colicins
VSLNIPLYRYLIFTVLLVLSLQLMAQRTVVRIIDDQTSEPCMYSNVVLTGLDGFYIDAGATDQYGEIVFDLKQPAEISISFVGYQTLTERLSPGEIRTIRLQTDYISMDAVVVTGQYKPRKVDESIYKIDVVDAKTLQERGVSNLAEALSNETGIRLHVDPATGTSIEMQGMGGENVKYLIDGVPIVGRVLGNIDLSQINVENIDHIEIVQGPMAVQYGTSAIAGVINIITKKNNYFKNVIRGNSYIDTKGNYNFGLYGSVIRGNHTLALSGNRNIFQGIDIDLDETTGETGDVQDRYVEFRPRRLYSGDIEYAFRKKNFQLRVKSQLMNTLVKQYGNANEILAKAYDADFYTTRSTNSLTISDKITENLSYNLIGSYTYFGKRTEYITSDLYQLTHEVTDTTNTVFNNIMTRGNLTYAPVGSKISLMTGWDVNYDNGSGDKMEEDAEMGDYAIFVSSQYTPLKKLSLQPGLRLIYNTIYGAPLIPSMNLQWQIIESLGLRLSYARGFRAPSLKELYIDFHDSNHDIYGNKDLKAETTNCYNASFDLRIRAEKFNFKLEPHLFFNDGKNVITLIMTGTSTNAASYTNLGRRRTAGGEINASLRHVSGLMIGGGFTRIGETYSDDSGDFRPVIYYNNFSVNTRYSFRKLKAVAMANLKYYGKTPSLTSIPEESGGGYYQVFVDPYGDLEVTFTKNLWKNRIYLVIGGKNLLNNYIRTISGYRDFGQSDFQDSRYGTLNYGRTYFVKLNVKLIR